MKVPAITLLALTFASGACQREPRRVPATESSGVASSTPRASQPKCDIDSYRPLIESHFVQRTMTTLAKPIYPVEAAREGIEGAVNVRILVDQTGSVVRTCVLNGPEPLRKAAERAALACRFKRNFGSPGPLRGGYRTDTLAYLFVLDRARKVDEIHYIVIRPQE